MQIVIEIETKELEKDKTIEEMVKELAEKGWVSSSALYIMSKEGK